MQDRNFGLSRFEKIRIEALRAAQKMMALPTVYTRSAEKWPEIQHSAEDIEAWLLSADESHVSAASAESIDDGGVGGVHVIFSEDDYAGKGGHGAGGGGNTSVGVHIVDATSGAGSPMISGCHVGAHAQLDREVQQFAWLRREVDAVHALPADCTREQVIRRWYDLQEAKLNCYELIPVEAFDYPEEDDLAISSTDGAVMRFASIGSEGDGLWFTVREFPGVRVVEKHMKWSPGIWPPMQGGAGGVSEVML